MNRSQALCVTSSFRDKIATLWSSYLLESHGSARNLAACCPSWGILLTFKDTLIVRFRNSGEAELIKSVFGIKLQTFHFRNICI